MGNLDTKLSPYYAIIDENNPNCSSNSKSLEESFLSNNSFNPSLWIVKKVNFNENKNSILFEFNYAKFVNDAKKVSTKHVQLALNQIKKLKVLRHPNIVKYLYSEEPQNLNLNVHHFKCLLITETIKPLNSIINVLSKEQIISGLFGITKAISFLHEKAFTSHNNINESCIYLNTKQVWKISDFELALSLADLNRENLKLIYEFKNKNAITPEEELEVLVDSAVNSSRKNNKYDLNVVYKQHPHSIDSYAWAMLVFNLLTSRKEKNTPFGKHNALFYSLEQKESNTSITSIIENEEHEDEYCLEELEKFLNKDPTQRPTVSYALNLSLFDLYNDSSSSSTNSSYNEYVHGSNMRGTESSVNGEHFDPFKIDDLNKLDANWSKLIFYLKSLTQTTTQTQPATELNGSVSPKTTSRRNREQFNEKLIDFLLSPLMFFSEKVRIYILSGVLIPKGEMKMNGHLEYLKLLLLANANQFKQRQSQNDKNERKNSDEKQNLNANENGMIPLEPFMDLDKYKAFVLPRIINLFSMHSTQIRLVLLEYFPFYITLVNDSDTLRYEILPELLFGLKDKNDQLVSLTFCCLSIMVQLLGSEIVVGQPSSSRTKRSNNQAQAKFFSDNIPKTILHNIVNDSAKSAKAKAKQKKHPKTLRDKNLLNLAASFDEDLMNVIHSNDETMIKADKIFSDSMIALHDENGSTNDLSSIVSKSETTHSHSNNMANLASKNYINSGETDLQQGNDNDNDEDWSHDFGWSDTMNKSNGNIDSTNENNRANESMNNNLSIDKEKLMESASLMSLVGSDMFDRSASVSYTSSISRDMKNQNTTTAVNTAALKFIGFNPSKNDQIFSQYDIKNIVIKKSAKSDPSDDLIENFLNDITPKIEKKPDINLSMTNLGLKFYDSNLNDATDMLGKHKIQSKKDPNGIEMNLLSDKNTKVDAPKWDCDEISDLED